MAKLVYGLDALEGRIDIWGDGMERGKMTCTRLCFRILGTTMLSKIGIWFQDNDGNRTKLDILPCLRAPLLDPHIHGVPDPTFRCTREVEKDLKLLVQFLLAHVKNFTCIICLIYLVSISYIISNKSIKNTAFDIWSIYFFCLEDIP